MWPFRQPPRRYPFKYCRFTVSPPTPTASRAHPTTRSHPRRDDLERLPVYTRRSRPRYYTRGSSVGSTRRLRRDTRLYRSDLRVLTRRLSSQESNLTGTEYSFWRGEISPDCQGDSEFRGSPRIQVLFSLGEE